MTRDGYEAADIARLDPQLVADCLNESDRAKQLLRGAGFGVTGTGLLATAREALGRVAELEAALRVVQAAAGQASRR